MHALNEHHWMALGNLYGLVRTANFELNDALYTGDLQHSQSAVHAVRTAANELEWPEDLVNQMRLLAWQSLRHTERKGDALQCAGLACNPIEQIEQMLEDLFIEHGRMALAKVARKSKAFARAEHGRTVSAKT